MKQKRNKLAISGDMSMLATRTTELFSTRPKHAIRLKYKNTIVQQYICL
jgi:superfamily I DNA and RNA helicase